jgi:hypothetical protein
VGLLSDGFEEQLSALFTAIIASNANQGTGSSPKAGKRISREVNNLFCSINYDTHSSSALRCRKKARAQTDFYEA